jgi:hypothetical protein
MIRLRIPTMRRKLGQTIRKVWLGLFGAVERFS